MLTPARGRGEERPRAGGCSGPVVLQGEWGQGPWVTPCEANRVPAGWPCRPALWIPKTVVGAPLGLPLAEPLAGDRPRPLHFHRQQFPSAVDGGSAPAAPLTGREGLRGSGGQAHPASPVHCSPRALAEGQGPPLRRQCSTCFPPAEWRGGALCFRKRQAPHPTPHTPRALPPLSVQCGQGIRAFSPPLLGSQGFLLWALWPGEASGRRMKEGVSVLHPDSQGQRRGGAPPPR